MILVLLMVSMSLSEMCMQLHSLSSSADQTDTLQKAILDILQSTRRHRDMNIIKQQEVL